SSAGRRSTCKKYSMRWSSPPRACAMRMTRRSFRCLTKIYAWSRTMGRFPRAPRLDSTPLPLVRGFIPGRAVLERRPIKAGDILAEAEESPESRTRALQPGYRTALCVPLVHAGEAIGVIFIRRTEVRPFTERQIELVNTFADQAVIAIENTRLFEEV